MPGFAAGIGFLGAGAILARGEVVRGLTTTASIWTVAAIGLAVGRGLFFAAAATMVIPVILAGVKPLKELYRARRQSRSLRIVSAHGVVHPEQLESLLSLRSNPLRRFVVAVQEGGAEDRRSVQLVRMSSEQISGITSRLTAVGGVWSVDIASRGAVGAMVNISRYLGTSGGTLRTADGKLLATATATCFLKRE